MGRNPHHEYLTERQRLVWSIFGWTVVAVNLVLICSAVLGMLAVTPA